MTSLDPTPAPPDEAPWDLTIVRVEVNVSAVIQQPDGSILGQNMVDTTLAFGWRTEVPDGVTDAQVNAALTKAVGPVVALISTNLTFNGWVAMGEVDDPLYKAGSTPVGEARSEPVTVRVNFVEEGNGVHD